MNLTMLQGLESNALNLPGVISDYKGFTDLILRFAVNISVIMILIRWLYYSTTRRKDYLFTYILISTIVFFLCYLLENVSLQLGFALGLFAIFGILRYRTDTIPIKEMTYLFIVIGISVINSLTDFRNNTLPVIFANTVVVLITMGLEKLWLLKHESSKVIIYEKIDLIKPERYNELKEDLMQRTGIQKIHRIETGKIDFLKDTCELTVFYYTTGNEMVAVSRTPVTNDEDDDD
ncbi:MAG: DUF4956 domain-containing protein [Bacteroidales bacterium]|nr:DUF4956 domain-containing protein [Bacteroidales bacterium]